MHLSSDVHGILGEQARELPTQWTHLAAEQLIEFGFEREMPLTGRDVRWTTLQKVYLFRGEMMRRIEERARRIEKS